MVFWRQNHVTFIFIKMMSHDLLVQMAYYQSNLFWFICISKFLLGLKFIDALNEKHLFSGRT